MDPRRFYTFRYRYRYLINASVFPEDTCQWSYLSHYIGRKKALWDDFVILR